MEGKRGLAELRRHGQASETVFRTWGALRCVFRFWTREGLLRADPMSLVERPRRDRVPIRPMSPEQTAKLLEQPDTRTTQGLRDRAMMMLMLDSGLRVSEALGLEAERIEGVRVSPHTLRHTFAVMCVRNGGDSFSLREILGHSTLEMTRRYVHLARRDVAERHKKFSPMEHLCAGGQDHWSRSLPMGPP